MDKQCLIAKARKGLKKKGRMRIIECSICGRKLRIHQSRELGYGPVCYKRKFGASPHISCRDRDISSVREEPDYNLPGQISMEEYLRTVFGE